jgi:hypothetical protein
MKKRHLLIAASALLLTGGCAAMAQMSEAMDKANARAERQQRQADNEAGMELTTSKDVYSVAQAVEAIMKEKGFETSSAPYRRGPGQGLCVTGKKGSNKDLGTQVGMNVLGNMLGADRSKIVTRTEEENIVWIWPKWNADFSAAEAGHLIMANAGNTHDINQGGQKVNEHPYDTGQMVAMRDGVMARVK